MQSLLLPASVVCVSLKSSRFLCKRKHFYNTFTSVGVDGSKIFLHMFYFTCNHGLKAPKQFDGGSVRLHEDDGDVVSWLKNMSAATLTKSSEVWYFFDGRDALPGAQQ